MPDTAAMPSSVWRAIWRDVASQSLPSYFGSPSGDLEFRTALAQYLGRARHVFCTAEDIVVTSGALQALNLLAQAMLKPGDPVGFEEPGYLMARQALLGQGLRILPIPVDEDGLKVDALPRGPEAPPLVYVTPSHQYPLGGRLSIARRMALLGWASENGRIIVEDDYDSEFRFDAPPLPALAGLDHAGRVVYIGTFSKIFMPSLRVGYLVTSNVELRQHIEHIRWLTDLHAAWPSQRALLSFIAGGHMDRHVLRMRRLYARKRALLNEILAPLAPIARLRGMEAGLHAYLELSEGLDSSDIAARLYERGVIVVPIDNFYFGKPDRTGLVLGYGALSMQDLARGVSILKEVIELRAAEFVKRK
jgi:GntR family transcriptional regulator/MocR family aminotransferase